MSHVLITGGNGNLGKLVGDQLLDRGIGAVKFDLPGTARGQTQEGEVIMEGDIRDQALLEKIITTHRPDGIIHLASLLSGSSERIHPWHGR